MVLSSCGQPTPEVVEKVVKETVVVEVEKTGPVTLRGYTFDGEKFPDGTTITYMAGMSVDQKRQLMDDAVWFKQATNIDLLIELGDDAKFNALLAAGTPPDIYYAGTPGIRSADGTFMALDDYIDEEFLSQYPEEFIEGYTGLDGKLYGVQGGGWFPVFWVNTKLLEEAGATVPDTDWTWDDLVEIGLKVTKDANGNRPTDSGFDAENVDVWGAWLGWFSDDVLVFSNGASRYDETHTKFQMDDPKVMEAWKFWADATCEHQIMPTNSWMGAEGQGASELFLAGRLAMFSDGINYDLFSRANDTFGSDGWKLVAFPHPDDHPLVLARYQGGYAVTSASKNPEAAVEAVKLLASAGYVWYPSIWLKNIDYVGYWEEVYPFLKDVNYRDTIEYSLAHIGPEPWNGSASPFTVDRYTQGWDFWNDWNAVRDCKMPFAEFDFEGYTEFANQQVVEGMKQDLDQAQLLPEWREALEAIYAERVAEQ
jgi:ABC-type glycerol-3-phosphate transport system substrate-binding protein